MTIYRSNFLRFHCLPNRHKLGLPVCTYRDRLVLSQCTLIALTFLSSSTDLSPSTLSRVFLRFLCPSPSSPRCLRGSRGPELRSGEGLRECCIQNKHSWYLYSTCTSTTHKCLLYNEHHPLEYKVTAIHT